ncbi:hypothetical protein ACSS6W_003896 [Trichoderma asperelloides]
MGKRKVKAASACAKQKVRGTLDLYSIPIQEKPAIRATRGNFLRSSFSSSPSVSSSFVLEISKSNPSNSKGSSPAIRWKANRTM